MLEKTHIQDVPIDTLKIGARRRARVLFFLPAACLIEAIHRKRPIPAKFAQTRRHVDVRGEYRARSRLYTRNLGDKRAHLAVDVRLFLGEQPLLARRLECVEDDAAEQRVQDEDDDRQQIVQMRFLVENLKSTSVVQASESTSRRRHCRLEDGEILSATTKIAHSRSRCFDERQERGSQTCAAKRSSLRVAQNSANSKMRAFERLDHNLNFRKKSLRTASNEVADAIEGR